MTSGMTGEKDVEEEEEMFHNTVRAILVASLFFFSFYTLAHNLIAQFKRQPDKEEYYLLDCDSSSIYEQQSLLLIYKIPYYLCTFSLACSMAAICLLPFSIISNEVLTRYPNNYYLQWLNRSLISTLWNSMFFFCNLNLFVLLPFAYFFTESEGIQSTSVSSIVAKVYETVLSLFWLTVLVISLVMITCAITNFDYTTYSSASSVHYSYASPNWTTDSRQNLLRIWDIWNFVPLLYSCMSLMGACLHLFCTPLGFAKLFTLLGKVLTKPQFMHDLEQERDSILLQKDLLQRRLTLSQSTKKQNLCKIACDSTSGLSRATRYSHELGCDELMDDEIYKQIGAAQGSNVESAFKTNGHLTSSVNTEGLLFEELGLNCVDLSEVERKLSTAQWRRNLGYPLMLLILLVMTCLCAFLVGINTIALLLGQTSLPFVQEDNLNSAINSINSYHSGRLLGTLGWFGVFTEVSLILYFMLASLIGFYNLPVLKSLLPLHKDTALHIIIVNCVFILIVSSALPLVMRTLGLTNFDLIGAFGRLKWLNNLYIVLFYNLLFATFTVWCLTHTFTAKVRQELYLRYLSVHHQLLWYYSSCSRNSKTLLALKTFRLKWRRSRCRQVFQNLLMSRHEDPVFPTSSTVIPRIRGRWIRRRNSNNSLNDSFSSCSSSNNSSFRSR